MRGGLYISGPGCVRVRNIYRWFPGMVPVLGDDGPVPHAPGPEPPTYRKSSIVGNARPLYISRCLAIHRWTNSAGGLVLRCSRSHSVISSSRIRVTISGGSRTWIVSTSAKQVTNRGRVSLVGVRPLLAAQVVERWQRRAGCVLPGESERPGRHSYRVAEVG